MKKECNLILKGVLIGFGKVIPGISGSLIAVSLGVYEKAIEAISHFFRNIKENMLFLGTLSIGLILSIAFGSKIIIYLLEFCYVPTMLLLIGFITGVFPSLYGKMKIKNSKLLFFFLLSVLLILCLNFFSTNSNFYPKKDIVSYFSIFGIGFLDAATMIIPGISGTALFMILGCYAFVLNLFSSFTHLTQIYSNLPYFFFFGLGLMFGVIFVSKWMHYMLKHHLDVTYALIMGFTISSIIVLLQKVFTSHYTFIDIVIGLILAVIGYRFSVKFGGD